MSFPYQTLTAALLAALSHPACADEADEVPTRSVGIISVQGQRVSSLPTRLPTTIEGIDARRIEATVNATDAEDALKYLPSLNVRKRYNGDYDHAVLASRASGTGNSARSLVYADGMLLANLLGNGASYTPRWGMVTPEEIERVDVLYGPFSAAYPGNAVGAVVDYLTRMPRRFEAHAKLSGFSQPYRQYGSHHRYGGQQASASLGDRDGGFAWWFNVNRLASDSQPIAFANKLVRDGKVASGGEEVSGAIADRNPKNQGWWILGATNQIHTVQDHAKLKLAYDVSPTLRASYNLGWWHNTVDRSSESYLRNAAGQPVYGGLVNIGTRQFNLTPADFAPSQGDLNHLAQGVTLKSNRRAEWDWVLAASRYDYLKDAVRTPTVFLPAALSGGTGQLSDMQGSGWQTAALTGTWRPAHWAGAHVLDMGYQAEQYRLRTLVSATTDWLRGPAGARISAFNGNSRLQSLYLQDSWRPSEDWRTTLGGRYEHWQAWGGEIGNASTIKPLPARQENVFSPKAALAWQATTDWTLKASLGRAVRMPTVAELYQGSIAAGAVVNNDPDLKPERSWTSELSAERELGLARLRTTLFVEDSRDALYTQTNVTVSPAVTNIQNIEQIRTSGLELAVQTSELGLPGLDLAGSVTYADSRIIRNSRFPASVGKWQPRVPQWRGNLLLSYQAGPRWQYSLGGRYSGRQFGTLDNSDPNGATYTGVSRYLVLDARVRYRLDKQWSGALGVDNLNNARYWAFHPYTQRTVSAELKYDL